MWAPGVGDTDMSPSQSAVQGETPRRLQWGNEVHWCQEKKKSGLMGMSAAGKGKHTDTREDLE